MPHDHLTVERVRHLFDYDASTGLLTRRVTLRRGTQEAGQIVGFPQQDGYCRLKVDKKPYLAHHIAWLHYHGSPVPRTHCIDHINHDKSDNRLVNLRLVPLKGPHQARNQKMHTRNTSGTTGVFWNKRDKLWNVTVGRNGSLLYVGTYKVYEDAVSARLKAQADLGYHPNHSKPLPQSAEPYSAPLYKTENLS